MGVFQIKTPFKLLLIAFVIIVGVVTTMAIIKSSVTVNLPEGFTVTAHSGSEGTEDNSMEFLQKCVEIDVEVLEIDVTFREDGTPVLLHKEIAENNEGVLFEEAIKYISENSDTIRINLDLKSVANLPAVAETVDKYGMRGRCFYTGVGEAFVETVRKDGELPYYLNLELNRIKKHSNSELEKALEKVKSAGAIGINCNHKYASKEMVTLFHENRLLVSYWTANSVRVMKKLIALSPDNITTRRPTELTELINIYK